MRFLPRSSSARGHSTMGVKSLMPPVSSNDSDIKPSAIDDEATHTKGSRWKISCAGDGDTTMALFPTPDEVHKMTSPEEAKRLERRIDYMILPYLAVSVIQQTHL